MRKGLFIFIAAMLAVIATGCNNKSKEPDLSNNKDAGTVTDICGNMYRYVKIGTQYWLAENMRCNKYDTESERPNVTIPMRQEKDCESHDTNERQPFCFDVSDKSTWKTDQNAKDLTDLQIKQLGYLYTWSAVVGIATGEDAIDQAVFEFNKQSSRNMS